MKLKTAFALCLGALTLTFANPAVAAKNKQAMLPPYSGAYQPQGVDERGVWMIADEDERALRDSRFILNDHALTEYVRGVLCRTVGNDRCGGVRLYVVRFPVFNASMAPNGTMQVWSGLLLRVKNEAELAAVLAHEFAHFEARHTLASYKQRRTAGDIMSWTALMGTNGVLLQQAAFSSMFSFSRAQEQDADMRSFGYLAASPYNPACFANVWERLMDEADATALGRKQRSQRYDRVAFFASHPTQLTRATYLRDLATKTGDEGEENAEAYRTALAKWMPDLLEDQIKLNDFGGTEYLLGELAGDNWTPELLFARAELYRSRGNPRDLVAAAGFYRDAIASGSTRPEARRGLGLVLLRSQELPAGRDALKSYLSMKPDATDAPMMSALIEQMKVN